jgi:filamentous hemagglutinin family protein
MTIKNKASKSTYCLVCGVLVSVSAVAFPSASAAQPAIVSDDTLGNNRSDVQVDPSDPTVDVVRGGVAQGGNRFHSFTRFDVDEGRSVRFLNSSNDTLNIFARVTGNDRSFIMGQLGIQNELGITSNPNLFLINPNGITFGPNSRLNVSGSFFATTANAIQFGNQGSFSTITPDVSSQVLSINPTAFLFGQGVPQSIVSQARPVNSNESVGLRVPNEQSLLFLGGNIFLDSGYLSAPGGRVELGAIAQMGTVGLNPDRSLDFPENAVRGDIHLTRSMVNVAASQGGDMGITARRFIMSEGSQIAAGINSGEVPRSQAGDITLNVTQLTRLQNSSRIGNTVSVGELGNGGNIIIETGNLQVSGQSELDTSTDGTNSISGRVMIFARNQVVFDGDGKARSDVGAEAVNSNSGGIEIYGNSLRVSDNAELRATVEGIGNSGRITIHVRDRVRVAGASNISTLEAPNGNGNSGNINITARSVVVRDSDDKGDSDNLSELNTSVSGQGDSEAGNIVISVDGNASFAGRSGVFTSVTKGSTGVPGNIRINARNLRIVGNSEFNSSVSGELSEDAGNRTFGRIQINAENSVRLREESSIRTGVNTQAEGRAGEIRISSRLLSIEGTSEIESNSLGNGLAGGIYIEDAELVSLSNGNISARSEGLEGSIPTSSNNRESRNQIVISSEQIRLQRSSNIQTDVRQSQEAAGNITLNASDYVLALDDADILAFANLRGGQIEIISPVFFANSYQPATGNFDLREFDVSNNRVDINVNANQPGTINLPDNSFVRNNLTPLENELINTDRLLSSSCIVQNNEQGNFTITGSGGFPTHPGEVPVSPYPTGEVRSLPDSETTSTVSEPSLHAWKPGDPIIEPQRISSLTTRQRVVSRECPSAE